MVSVASQLIEEVTEHAQSDSLEYAQEICADGTGRARDMCRRYRTCKRYVQTVLTFRINYVLFFKKKVHCTYGIQYKLLAY